MSTWEEGVSSTAALSFRGFIGPKQWIGLTCGERKRHDLHMQRLWIIVILCSLSNACTGDFIPGADGNVLFDAIGTGDSGGTNINRPSCPGQETTITGTVYAPNGVDPVPGATVFVPAKVPELFPPEVKCEACASLGSSYNFWTTTSLYDGTFSLEGVCPGQRPLLLQNGRFRRFLRLEVPANTTMPLGADKTRLPRRSAEFDAIDAIPKIAVATGDYDKMECVLNKIGLETGQFDLYEAATFIRKSPAIVHSFDELVRDLAKMKTYNIIFINCTTNTYENLLHEDAIKQNLQTYVNEGGRLYVTDWSYDWIEQVAGFAPFIDFEPGVSGTTSEGLNEAALGKDGLQVQATIKDKRMAQWLGGIPGTISGDNVLVEHFLTSWVMMFRSSVDTKLWVEGTVSSEDGKIRGVRPLTVTFNFKDCGKILFTSYHTEGREEDPFNPVFPNYCGFGFSPQDRILEYLIFDIANCVGPVL
ncbi:MAG: hypothetical protein V1754_15215 [Pseudomonadota bacterium]